jgi:hypothetical protein
MKAYFALYAEVTDEQYERLRRALRTRHFPVIITAGGLADGEVLAEGHLYQLQSDQVDVIRAVNEKRKQ